LKRALAFVVNGEPRDLVVDTRRSLLDVLRDPLGLFGAHRGCDSGDCGACTVLRDGAPVAACLTLAVECDGAEIVTVEGITPARGLHPVQEALVRLGGIQCGFCTPGMVMSAVALLGENPAPSVDEVRRALAGNLCRCTGYAKIVEAVMAGAEVGVP